MTWIRITFFTSTWNVWRQFNPFRKYNKELDAEVTVEKIKDDDREFPRVYFESDKHGNGIYTKLIVELEDEEAIEKAKELWRKVSDVSQHPLDILEKIYEFIFDYDENPQVKYFHDGFERVEIKVNWD